MYKGNDVCAVVKQQWFASVSASQSKHVNKHFLLQTSLTSVNAGLQPAGTSVAMSDVSTLACTFVCCSLHAANATAATNAYVRQQKAVFINA